MNSGPHRPILKATPAMAKAARRAASSAVGIPKKPSMRLQRKPQVGEVYWCDFSPYNWPPEFDDTHLVVIVRSGGYIDATHMVVPLTKVSQAQNAYGHRMMRNPNPGSASESWAVCDHIYTVCTERLNRLRDASGARRKPEKIASEDIKAIGRKLFASMTTFRAQVFGDQRLELDPARPEKT